VIPLGVTPVPYDDDAVRDTLSRLELSQPYVLWTGTIEPRKNLPRLLAAWQRAGRKDETLVLVGPGGWGEDIDARLQTIDNVRTLGFVDRHTLGALYAGAALLCWPSLREGFGFPVLEAMIQGCPVITSRGTSTEEIAGDAALLVSAGNEPPTS
jgi:glycosyltransferase involved in cell wall biosynthesis